MIEYYLMPSPEKFEPMPPCPFWFLPKNHKLHPKLLFTSNKTNILDADKEFFDATQIQASKSNISTIITK